MAFDFAGGIRIQDSSSDDDELVPYQPPKLSPTAHTTGRRTRSVTTSQVQSADERKRSDERKLHKSVNESPRRGEGGKKAHRKRHHSVSRGEGGSPRRTGQSSKTRQADSHGSPRKQTPSQEEGQGGSVRTSSERRGSGSDRPSLTGNAPVPTSNGDAKKYGACLACGESECSEYVAPKEGPDLDRLRAAFVRFTSAKAAAIEKEDYVRAQEFKLKAEETQRQIEMAQEAVCEYCGCPRASHSLSANGLGSGVNGADRSSAVSPGPKRRGSTGDGNNPAPRQLIRKLSSDRRFASEDRGGSGDHFELSPRALARQNAAKRSPVIITKADMAVDADLSRPASAGPKTAAMKDVTLWPAWRDALSSLARDSFRTGTLVPGVPQEKIISGVSQHIINGIWVPYNELLQKFDQAALEEGLPVSLNPSSGSVRNGVKGLLRKMARECSQFVEIIRAFESQITARKESKLVCFLDLVNSLSNILTCSRAIHRKYMSSAEKKSDELSESTQVTDQLLTSFAGALVPLMKESAAVTKLPLHSKDTIRGMRSMLQVKEQAGSGIFDALDAKFRKKYHFRKSQEVVLLRVRGLLVVEGTKHPVEGALEASENYICFSGKIFGHEYLVRLPIWELQMEYSARENTFMLRSSKSRSESVGGAQSSDAHAHTTVPEMVTLSMGTATKGVFAQLMALYDLSAQAIRTNAEARALAQHPIQHDSGASSKLARGARYEKVEDGTKILHEGAEFGGVFQLATGTVRLEKNGNLLTTLSSGALLGEITMLEGGLVSADVIADGEVSYYHLSASFLQNVVASNLRLYVRLLRWVNSILAVRLEKTIAAVSAIPVQESDGTQVLQRVFELHPKERVLHEEAGVSWNNRVDGSLYISPNYLCFHDKAVRNAKNTWMLSKLVTPITVTAKGLPCPDHDENVAGIVVRSRKGEIQEEFYFSKGESLKTWLVKLRNCISSARPVVDSQSSGLSLKMIETDDALNKGEVDPLKTKNVWAWLMKECDAPTIEWTQGQCLLDEGDTGESLMLIVDGCVRVHKKRCVISRLFPGEVIGESGLISVSPSFVQYVAASSGAKVQVLSMAEIQKKMEADPAVGRRVWAAVGKSLAGNLRRISVQLAFKDVEHIFDNEIMTKLQDDKTGLPVADFSRGKRSFPECFRGKEFVDWALEQKQVSNRKEAVQLGAKLLDGYVFAAVDDKRQKFADSKNAVFRFRDSMKNLVSQVKAEGLLEVKDRAGKYKLGWAEITRNQFRIYRARDKPSDGRPDDSLLKLKIDLHLDADALALDPKDGTIILLSDGKEQYRIRADGRDQTIRWLLVFDEAMGSRSAVWLAQANEELQEWVTKSRAERFPLLAWPSPEADQSHKPQMIPLDCRKDGFSLEFGRDGTREYSKAYPFEDAHSDILWYRTCFAGRTHSNYLLEDAKLKVVVVSILPPSNSDDGESSKLVRAIVRHRRQDIRSGWIAFGQQPLSDAIILEAICQQVGLTVVGPKDSLRTATSQDFQLLNNSAESLLLQYEDNMAPSKNYKWGVLFAKKGQCSLPNELAEDAMFTNQSDPQFEKFLDVIGQRIKVDGWSRFAGGLDVSQGSTGKLSYFAFVPDDGEEEYAKQLEKEIEAEYLIDKSEPSNSAEDRRKNDPRGSQIMFHVAPFLPFLEQDVQMVERKRHLGNDIVVIVYKEDPDEEFDPRIIHSQFNHVWCVVSPAGTKGYHVSFVNKAGTPPYGPSYPDKIHAAGKDLRQFLHKKLLNAERSALTAPDFRDKKAMVKGSIFKLLQDTVEQQGRRRSGSNSAPRPW